MIQMNSPLESDMSYLISDQAGRVEGRKEQEANANG